MADGALQRKPFFQLLSENGDGTGNTDATGNYSGSPTAFYIQPPTDKVYRVSALAVVMEDNGALDPNGYGGGSALTNGILYEVREGTTAIVDLGGASIKTNLGWESLATGGYASGDKRIVATVIFSRVVRLDGALNRNLALIMQDNLSGLTSHQFLVNGTIENEFL